VGRLSEVYARETLEIQARWHGWRFFGESHLQAALSRPGTGKSCDLTIDDGRRWALFEVTSSRLTRESVASTSAEHLHNDIDKLVGKLAQIDATVSRSSSSNDETSCRRSGGRPRPRTRGRRRRRW
jgi:hypothetical protein